MKASTVTDSQYPLITFSLIAYNQERYVSEAIAAAFAQTYSPLEIILSDDCSSDSTFEIMQRAEAEYKGPHRVVLNRNPVNLNIGDHINAIAALAKGELIVLAAGDDISLPSRTRVLARHWDDLGRPTAVLCSDFEPIDIASKSIELAHEMIYRGPFLIENMARGDVRVLGATTAVTRDVFSKFFPMESAVRHEDRVLPFRAVLLGGIVSLVDEKLVCYRVEGGISRTQPKSARDFLYHYTPAILARTLPDAAQRLIDIDKVSPTNAVLRKQCLMTIANHQAHIDLAKARGFGLEVMLIRWILRGAKSGSLIRLYLKMRFFWIFYIYYKIRAAQAL